MNEKKVYKTVLIAIFVAIVFVVQLIGTTVPISLFGVSLSFVLIPIVIGGILTGPTGGAILGFTFGLVTVIGGVSGLDPFTAALLSLNSATAIWTVLLCIVKATAAGWGSAYIYRLIAKKSQNAGVVVAAVSAPVINTGIFVLGALTVLSDAITACGFVGSGQTLIFFVLFILAGKNFIAELIINIIFSPAIFHVISKVKKGKV